MVYIQRNGSQTAISHHPIPGDTSLPSPHIYQPNLPKTRANSIDSPQTLSPSMYLSEKAEDRSMLTDHLPQKLVCLSDKPSIPSQPHHELAL
ncbi:PREDICTED: uncharacterized protein LOC109131812 [Camelina sativa]|uniref:Uncharacterized protein LOC109131812 n=1 Tax=Camelina sativa TaxID=90675 RepID=A0ABM1RHP7_CAMSA|nr:PREDICTED: uncharacterized protein LOC109131812 [Camelina sativa]